MRTCEQADRGSAFSLQVPLQQAVAMPICTTLMLAPLERQLEHHMCIEARFTRLARTLQVPSHVLLSICPTAGPSERRCSGNEHTG